MIAVNPELGLVALIMALPLGLLVMSLPLWGALTGDRRLMATAAPLTLALLGCVALSYAVLTAAYVGSDFSVENAFQNSHSTQPLLYKFTSVWGNHEGSMLLWLLILCLFSGFVVVFGRALPKTLRTLALVTQGWIATAFVAFILFTSNPFRRLLPPPPDGRDLNPILQDIGLAVHPPMLYLGYVGFSVAFSFAMAALIEGKIDAAWARFVRPWVLTAWIFLTLGIAMGSYWAYYELGWGGWWFWDPVENASLMPWLVGTALLHSVVVMEKREALKVWTILLAILAFSLSLLGTFLVRSGVLTSVHSFASDPSRGVFILSILAFFIGGALTLFAARASTLKQGGLFAPISREGALILNNLLLSAAAATVLVGTLYPLALETLNGAKISVGPPFFNLSVGLLALPLCMAVPFGPFLAWKRGDLLGAAQRLMLAFGLAVAGVLATYAFAYGGAVFAPLGIGLGLFLIFGALAELAERSALFKQSLSIAFARAKGLPLAAYGTALAHAGMGVLIIGITAESAWNSERIVAVKPGETVSVRGYDLTLDGMFQQNGPNYQDVIARFTLRQGGVTLGTMEPKKRVYTVRNMPTTEAALRSFGFSQLYLSLGDVGADGSLAVRLYHKPLVLLIWIGSLIMAFGGAVSLADRRFRIGAPQRAKKLSAQPQPAE